MIFLCELQQNLFCQKSFFRFYRGFPCVIFQNEKNISKNYLPNALTASKLLTETTHGVKDSSTPTRNIVYTLHIYKKQTKETARIIVKLKFILRSA